MANPLRAQAGGEDATEPGFGFKPATLVRYSTHLNSIARLMLLAGTLCGGYLGYRLTPLLMMAAPQPPADSDFFIHIAIGAVLGLLSVAWVAFLYMYIAQLTMCLLQIERNTRRQ